MRRLIVFTVLLIALPASAAWATDLDELLQRGQGASYSAEQVISCSTPDGVRDAVVNIAQSGGELRVTSSLADDVEVATGAGEWSLSRQGGLIVEASVDAGTAVADPLYVVEDVGSVVFLGRDAMAFRLIRGTEPRAELIFDNQTGALVHATTFTGDGEIYCERRFISFDTSTPAIEQKDEPLATTSPTLVEESDLPQVVAGFERLDHYEDEEGVRFAYYSDGFFSFALFETPTAVTVPEPTLAELESGRYRRAFTAGQVIYVWETRHGGMALVGDLPPDLHDAVLAEMPRPEDPGLFRRWWRALFG